MQPMNYTLNTPNTGDAFMQGAERAAGFANMQAQAQQAQQKAQAMQAAAERQAYQQKRFQEVAQDPTSGKVQKLLLEFPDIAEQTERAFKSISETERQTAKQVKYMIRSALKQGQPEVAVQELDRMIEAAKNSGDVSLLQKLEIEKDSLLASPGGARLAAESALFSLMGKDFATMVAEEGAEERAKEKSPYEIRKLAAEAIQEELTAQFAPEKFLADIGLTKAQTGQARASAASSYASAAASQASARRANAEAAQIGSGIIPAEKRPEAETKMRDEYYKRTGVYQDVKNSYQRVLASKNDAAGDLALIFGYMKMLDPGSVVREGEFANAQNAAGVPERILNIYNKAARGERLTEGQRKMFKGQAEAIYKATSKQEEETRKGIERIAKGYGLNTENVFYTQQESNPEQQSSPLTVGTELPGGFVIKGIQPGAGR